MRLKDRSFPHPVLSPFRDDVEPRDFSTRIDPDVDSQNYVIRYAFSLSNPTLLDLVKKKTASYSIHVECRSNFFRKLFTSSEAEGVVKIPAVELNGTVDVSSFITACEKIPDYKIIGAHPDYGDHAFSIRIGDVLAIAPATVFEAEKQHDPLKRIASILQLVPGDDLPDGIFSVGFEEEKITIFLSNADFEHYRQIRAATGISGLLAQALVVPVIAQAVNQIRDDDPQDPESSSEKRWFRVISQRLREQDPHYATSGKPSLELAQSILGKPLGRCFKELLMLTERNDQETSQ